MPTRGQVIAIRPNLGAQVGKSSWRGNGGFEYWFPRYAREEEEERPLVILGGGRDSMAPRYEMDENDDSVVNVKVGKTLRGFLPPLFPGMYDPDREVEWEWVSVLSCTLGMKV